MRLLLAVIAALLVAGAIVGGYWAGERDGVILIPSDRPRQLGAFRLTDHAGRTVDDTAFRGRPLVVSFVFTSCSISCLQVSHHMRRILEEVRKSGRPDVQFLSITVDPKEDRPDALAAFRRKFTQDTTDWRFLTGEPGDVHTLLGESFLARSAPGVYNPMPGGYEDADRIAVVDPQGRILGYVNGLQPDCVQKVLHVLDSLPNETR